MRKFLLSALAILVAMGLMGSAFAYFSDTESSEGNTFTAGTFGLTLDGESLPLHTWDMKPSDSYSEEHGVTNVGTIAGEVWFTAENFIEPRGEYPYFGEPPEPESGIEVGPRDFADILRIRICPDLDSDTYFEEDEVVYDGSLLKLEQGDELCGRFPINPGQYIYCQFLVYMPDDLNDEDNIYDEAGTTGYPPIPYESGTNEDDNAYQADGVEWDILWHGSTEITID